MIVPVSIVSLNINGTRLKEHMIDELCDRFDIVCLQEHLLTSTSINVLKRSRNHSVFTTNAEVTFGRPSGGLACIVKNNLSLFSPVFFHSDKFILAVRFGNTVLINVYLPCNKKTISALNAYMKASANLKAILASVVSTGYDFIVVGDFNTDITSQSVRSDIVLDAFSAYKIVEKSVDYSYIHQSGSLSNIDHVVSSPNINVSTVLVHEDYRDIDHLPISFSASVVASRSTRPFTQSSKWFYRNNWSRANFALYITTLSALLGSIKVPYHLLQVTDRFSNDKQSLNEYYDKIIWCLKQAEATAVPLEKIKVKTRKPEWVLDPELKVVKNKAKFWLRIWVSCGRPNRGVVFDLKQSTKRAYKKRLRQSRVSGFDFPASRKEWSHVLNSDKLSSDFSESPIAVHTWVSYYNDIFGKVNREVEKLFSNLLESCLPNHISQSNVLPVSTVDIGQAIKNMQSSSVDQDGISSYHLKVVCPTLIDHLQLLFQMCLSTSMVPDSFLCGTVTSVLKRGKTSSECSSYRPITVSCTLSKVFEYILLPFISENVNFGENQFGFQKRLGCQHAHRVLASLLLQSVNDKSPLHICALDLSKAFDSIVHSHALYSLFSNNINLSIVVLLRYWYSNSFIRVKCNGVVSDSKVFLRRGVRQGGVLSPTIFKLCIAPILSSLPSTFISDGIDVSYLAYADDVLLVSSFRAGLSHSVSRISDQFRRIGLMLNVDKCEYISFNSSASLPLNCGFFSIPCVSSFRWLGLHITNNLKTLRALTVSNAKKKKIRLDIQKLLQIEGGTIEKRLGNYILHFAIILFFFYLVFFQF